MGTLSPSTAAAASVASNIPPPTPAPDEVSRPPSPSSPSKKRKDAPSSSAVTAAAAARMMFHPTSEWLEPDRDDGLTLYEIHRPPLRVDVGSNAVGPGTTVIRVRRSLQDINNEFKCGICLQYIANARMVRNCLHRFCSDCAETALRNRYKQCPICRAPMGSRRCLAPDPAFDTLVRAIVGDPASDPLQTLDRDDEGHSHNAERLQGAIQQKRLWLRQQQQQQQPPTPSTPGPPARSDSWGATTPDNDALFRHEDWIRVELRRHEQETNLDDLRLPYLRLQKHMPLVVIQTFLLHKLDLFSKQKKDAEVPSETPEGSAAQGMASDDAETDAPQVDGKGEETMRGTPISVQLYVQTPDYIVHPLEYYSHDTNVRRESSAPATAKDHGDDAPPQPSSSSRTPVLLGAVYRQYHQHGRLRLFYRRVPASPSLSPARDSPAPRPGPIATSETQGEGEGGAGDVDVEGSRRRPVESTPPKPS